MVRSLRVWLNKENTKYCTVRLYSEKIKMQLAYLRRAPFDNNHDSCLGAHVAYSKFKVASNNKTILSKQTGTVFLSMDNCGAGIVTHELMHAILWAHKHHLNKKQYPIVIKSMEEEEEILHNHTRAVTQFYNWYWAVENNFAIYNSAKKKP